MILNLKKYNAFGVVIFSHLNKAMFKLASLFVVIIPFLTMGFSVIKKEEESPPYLQFVSDIVKPFVLEIEKEFNLRCVGDGGNMPWDVERIRVVFDVKRRASIEEARELEVKIVDRLLKLVNSHEQIRPYLREYPFTPARIGINITFNNEYNKCYADGTIAYINSARGKLFYASYDPIENQFIDLFDEPYEEAQKIVQSKPLNRDLRFHQMQPFESSMDQMLDDFEREVKKKWGLYTVIEGGKMTDGIDEIAVNFRTPHRATIEKARKLEIELTERLLELINSNEKIRPYLKEYPFTPNRTKISITFRKFDDTYYMDGSVAVVHQAGNKVFYLTKLPPVDNRYTIRPVPLSEETYEEAKQKLTK